MLPLTGCVCIGRIPVNRFFDNDNRRRRLVRARQIPIGTTTDWPPPYCARRAKELFSLTFHVENPEIDGPISAFGGHDFAFRCTGRPEPVGAKGELSTVPARAAWRVYGPPSRFLLYPLPRKARSKRFTNFIIHSLLPRKPDTHPLPSLPLVCLLGASVGQPMAMPAAKIPGAVWEIEFTHPAPTRYPAHYQRTGKPPAAPA